MEFRPTTLSRGLSLSNRPVDDLKVCGQDHAVGVQLTAAVRRQLQGKQVR